MVVCVYRAPNFPYAVLLDYLDDLTHKSLRERKQIIDYLNNSLFQARAPKAFIEVNQLEQLITEPTRTTDFEYIIGFQGRSVRGCGALKGKSSEK